MIYFTSDLHFGHNNILALTKRPFATIEEMDQMLIQRWNERVKAKDEVYILGDVTMKKAMYANQILQQLNGRKYLVKGNHDAFVTQQAFDASVFIWIKDYYELHYEGDVFVLFHYPIEEWDGYFRRAYHLHGHQHNVARRNAENAGKDIRRYDVGVDANQFAPVSIEEIKAYFEKGE